MNEFDLKAAEWDINPMHWERSQAITGEILKTIPLSAKMTALEYGAGTGIASFLLKDQLKEITLMDSSKEMVRITNEKITRSKSLNLRAIEFDLEKEEYTSGKFDLIFTNLVLHHVSDIKGIVRKFSTLINNNGYLSIADLCEEDGSFHGEGFSGHNGFSTKWLSDILKENGFSEISCKVVYKINKKISETDFRVFDVFLLSAKKI
jgi:2-polyprenyl-3-methyl-5-hydroxy-6-metoxy-1,4-benzoquinol methylase